MACVYVPTPSLVSAAQLSERLVHAKDKQSLCRLMFFSMCWRPGSKRSRSPSDKGSLKAH